MTIMNLEYTEKCKIPALKAGDFLRKVRNRICIKR